MVRGWSVKAKPSFQESIERPAGLAEHPRRRHPLGWTVRGPMDGALLLGGLVEVVEGVDDSGQLALNDRLRVRELLLSFIENFIGVHFSVPPIVQGCVS